MELNSLKFIKSFNEKEKLLTLSFFCIVKPLKFFNSGKISFKSFNKKNGIHITGVENYARVVGNPFIQYNKFAGVRVDQSAAAVILRNSVSKNLSQVIY